MKKISSDEIAKWRIEILNAEKLRSEQLGQFEHQVITRAGEHLDYFESGFSTNTLRKIKALEDPIATINIIFPIVKNVIPTLYWKNPYITATPKRIEDEDSSIYAATILNYFYDELDIKNVNRQIIFDAYVIGMGVCKIGYATQFGADIPDDNLKKEREKQKTRGILEKLGLKKPKPENEEEKQNIELNEYIRSENPYVEWISPFDFIIDPAANSISTARWVGHRTVKILSQVKNNQNYSNTKDLQGTDIVDKPGQKVPGTEIENFKTIDLYEIHYRQDDGIYILTLAKDQSEYEALRHEKSPYKMDGFQFEVLYFNKHNHKLYPKSDIAIVKGLQDRITTTFDNILDQVDKYVPKIFVDELGITEQGKTALTNGDIGAIVNCNRDPNTIVKEASFTQLKSDLNALIERLLEIIMLETGLTRAQLMGMTSAQTATEAQIGQAGQNLRLSDKFDYVADFASRQARKLWQVIQQFVDLEEIQLITGDSGIDEATGLPKFSWLPDITSSTAEKLSKGEYRFKIDVGSTEKPDLPILRQQVERMAQLLTQPGILQAFQMQGYKIELAEFAKRYLQLFPYVFPDIGKIIKPITQNTTGLLSLETPSQRGGANNPANQPKSSQPPNMADIISAGAGEKGQGFPIA